MCDPVTLTIAATAVAAGGQLYGGMAANAQAKYEANVADENRKHEEAARDDAAARGATAQMQLYRQLSQRVGTQRAQFAASGVDVDFGSAGDLQADTRMLGLEDSRTLAENTKREMQGYDINAANFTMQARAARARGSAAMVGAAFGAASTILGGATQISKMGAARGNAASFAGSTGM